VSLFLLLPTVAVCAVAGFIGVSYQVTITLIKSTKLSHINKPAIAYDRMLGVVVCPALPQGTKIEKFFEVVIKL